MGRVENVIVAVYTTYATERGHALIDRDLYVQADWFDDPARMAAARFPADHAFATKPALALAQAKRALAAGIRPRWATGDEVYGRSAALREFCEAVGIGYVFAVPVDHQVTTSGGVRMRADQALGLAEHAAGTAARAERERRGRATTTGRGSPPADRAANCSSAAPSPTRTRSRTSTPTRPKAMSAL
jgi:SRSO17 transposase